MSQIIAPGKWDPITRRLAKALAMLAGLGLMYLGGTLSMSVVAVLKDGRDPSLLSVVLALVPLGIGAVAVFPNVLTPLIVKAIDKWGKDPPDVTG